MKKDSIPPNIRAFMLPVGLLFVLIVLFIFSFKIGLERIKTQRDTLNKAQSDEKILTDKESLLRQFEIEVGSTADTTATALPDKNPALSILSQLKAFAATRGIILANAKIGQEVTGQDVSRVDITFDADGDFTQVMDFLNSLENVAPIIFIGKTKITQIAGISRATTTIRGFWAPLPSKLPSLTEPIKDLTSAERELLQKVTSLSQPAFLEIVPAEASGRIDPFN